MAGVTSNPKINISLLPAGIVDAFADRRDLIVGQIGPAGTAISGQLYTNVNAMTRDEISVLFGTSSNIVLTIFMWFQGNGGYSPLDVIAVAPSGTGVAASSTVTATGTATADGSYTISIVDKRRYTTTVSIPSGTIQNDIATAINTGLVGILEKPFSNSVATNIVTIAALDKGTGGNSYGIEIEGVVPGVTLALTAFLSGANDPTLTTLLDPIDGRRYTGLLWPTQFLSDTSETANAITEFESRFNASNAILDGVIFTGKHDTFANALSNVQARNTQVFCIMGNNQLDETFYKGPAILQPADWTAAYFMGVRSRRTTPSAPISDFIVTTQGSLDVFGGPSLASLPYFNTPLNVTIVTLPENLYNQTEQGSLETDGWTTFGVNPANNTMIMGPLVTPWTTDAAGNDNVSFHYLNYVDTGSACREIFFNTLKAVYSQSRLTEGDLIPGRAMANPESIKSELLRIYRVLSNAALTQAGREAESFFAENTTVTVSLADRQATITSSLPIVTQLGSINYALRFTFTVGETGTTVTF